MQFDYYASLIQKAERGHKRILMESLTSLGKSLDFTEPRSVTRGFSLWVRELAAVNDHITVKDEDIEAAKAAYHGLAYHLVRTLRWDDEDIRVFPQGSACTRTLIRSPFGGEKFDVDAVCAVNLARVDARNPMGFFETVGRVMERYAPEAKKRCWRLNFPNAPFYLEFTPSTPLNTVSAPFLESLTAQYRPVADYRATALAVVDTPEKRWKPSNPEGMSQWVNDIADLPLLQATYFAEAALRKAQIEPVPDQEPDIADTLRLAIRLFKRHRDMCAWRGVIKKEFQPISIILVTLVTSCYAGLYQLGHRYSHPIKLLADMVDLLPSMIDMRGEAYWVANPTVDGENFAEKWNEDHGERYRAFTVWCDTLLADLVGILAESNPQQIRKRMRDVFGVPDDAGTPSGLYAGGGLAGLSGTPATRRVPSPPPRGQGLA